MAVLSASLEISTRQPVVHIFTRVVDNPEQVAAPKIERPRFTGGLVSGLSLLIAVTALGLHFSPDIQRGIEALAQSLPVSVGGPLATMTRHPPPIFDAAGVEAAVMRVAGQIEGLENELLALGSKTETDIARLNVAVESLAVPGKLPLIVARIVLRHASNSLERHDIDTLAALAGSHPLLTEPVAQLKSLALEDVPTVAALRDAFRERRNAAQEAARRARMQWWEVPVDYARTGLSDIGISKSAAIDQDRNVIEQIGRELDSGRLDKALLEMQAASQELQSELSAWASAARLRVSLDQAVLLVIDGLLEQISLTKSHNSPG
jgi:hypothetical protein